MARVMKIGSMWYSDFRYNRKRYHRKLSKFKAEADLLLPDLIRQVRGLRPGEIQNMSWALFRAKYLDFSRTNKVHNTYYKDEHAFDLIDRTRSLSMLHDMTPDVLEEIKQEWIANKISPSTVTRSVKAIKRAMRRAEDLKWIPMQNWRTVEVEEPEGRQNYYSLEQFKRLLKVCEPAWAMCAMLQGRAGIRFGEAYNLEWQDVQFDQNRLRIHSRPGGWRIKGDRKGTAVKFIPLEPDLERYLSSRRKPSGFVVDVSGYSKADGSRMTENWFLNKFRTFFRRAGLKGKGHDLRHTCASWMINNGSSIDEVGAVLGHKPGSKATAIYTHIAEETKHAAIRRLPRL